MKTLGIDIGTTTVSAVVRSDASGVLAAVNLPNDSFLRSDAWARIQDPQRIWATVSACVDDLLDRFPDIRAIGLTGQMHGIVYLDGEGRAVSPLYTWQDGRGNLPYRDRSYAAHLSAETGYPLATGYGLVTHYHHTCNEQIPEGAVCLCTIADYIALRLTCTQTPKLDATMAASLGLYDLAAGCFDRSAVQRAGMDFRMLPALAQTPLIGLGPRGIPVYTAIGDNQASFLGAAEGERDMLLINMGTGGQISIYTPRLMQIPSLDTRPFPGGGYLLVGASLCGGRSYALLEQFFRQTAKMITGQDVSAYDAMARMLKSAAPVADLPQTITTFQGTRTDPDARGSILGLTAENFTPLHLTQSVLHGMAQELHEMYRRYLAHGGQPAAQIIGSGNGLRRNPWLCKAFETVFQAPMTLSGNEEEAACGAALYAAAQAQSDLSA